MVHHKMDERFGIKNNVNRTWLEPEKRVIDGYSFVGYLYLFIPSLYLQNKDYFYIYRKQ